MTFNDYLRPWNLTPDGPALSTATSHLLPVRHRGEPAMLKVATIEEERRGIALLAWWAGDGAVRVLAHDDHAVLMERASDATGLVGLAGQDDDQASRILCEVARRLHRPRGATPPPLEPLSTRFRALAPAAERYGGIFRDAMAEARALLDDPQEPSVLHGDLHHGNVLHFGGRGWLAIDPKGVWGERGFEFANIFCNPTADLALAPGRLARQVRVVAEAADLDPRRLTRWIVAWGGLSAAWHLEDGDEHAASFPLKIAAHAAALD